MSHRSRRVFRSLAVVTAAAAAVAVGGVVLAQADANDSPDHLVVYNNNVENMVPPNCYDTDFDLLFGYIKAQPESPDVFTVQQISNLEQLNALTKRMTDELPGTYAGEIAVENPGSMGYTSPCGKLKNQQTNAVIYRSDRFTLQQETRWRSDAPSDPKAGTGPCRNLEPTTSSQDRVHNVGVRLHDTVANKDVSVASIHWPTQTWNAHKCAAENMKEAKDAFDRLGGSLKIFGGDANAKPSINGWWDAARGYGFRDPIAEKCGGRDCSSDHNTTKNNRIDFILANGTGGFSNAATITESMTGGVYSEHRAVTAYVKY